MDFETLRWICVALLLIIGLLIMYIQYLQNAIDGETESDDEIAIATKQDGSKVKLSTNDLIEECKRAHEAGLYISQMADGYFNLFKRLDDNYGEVINIINSYDKEKKIPEEYLAKFIEKIKERNKIIDECNKLSNRAKKDYNKR